VSLIDSRSWRRVMRSRAGSRLLGTRPYRAVDTARRYVSTSLRSARDPGRFRDVESLCVFVGHVKSGGTLIGALLDAHPNAVVADEIDVLRYVSAGFRRDQIFDLLVKGSRREARKGRVTARRLEPYSLAVPGQWQGRYDVLHVIGESRAGPTTRRFGHDPRLLSRLYERMGEVRPRFVHVVRNPYDPIAAMIVRGKRSFADASSDYARQCRTLLELRGRIDPKDLLTVGYEDFVRRPRQNLERVCGFLGLEASDDYRAACARIVDPAFRPERFLIEWRPEHIDAVRTIIERNPFLNRYRGDDHGSHA
jgi:Sulfotransferase family